MKKIKIPNYELYLVLKKVLEHDSRKKVRLRAKILLEFLNDTNISKISRLCSCSINMVKCTVDSWNKDGIGSILTWRKTNTFKKPIKRRMMIEKLVSTSPRSIKLPFHNWSIRSLRGFIYNYLGIKYSHSTIYSDLKLINYSYRRTEHKLEFKVPEYEVMKTQLKFLMHFLPSTWKIIYLDEKGPIHAKRFLGRRWSDKPIIREKNDYKTGSALYCGAYSPKENHLEMEPIVQIKSDKLLEIIPKFVDKFQTKDTKKLIFIMDNHIVHHSKKFKQFFNRRRNLELVYLPRYSPELNPIELCFKHLQRELIDNSIFHTAIQLRRAVSKYITYFNNKRRGFICN